MASDLMATCRLAQTCKCYGQRGAIYDANRGKVKLLTAFAIKDGIPRTLMLAPKMTALWLLARGQNLPAHLGGFMAPVREAARSSPVQLSSHTLMTGCMCVHTSTAANGVVRMHGWPCHTPLASWK